MIDINKIFEETSKLQLKTLRQDGKQEEDDGRCTCEVFGDYGEEEKSEREEALENMWKVGE